MRPLLLLTLVAACGGGLKDGTAGGPFGPADTTTPVASVSLSAATLALNVGQTATLSASALAASGATLAGRTITWSSTAPTIASVSGTGFVTGLANGAADIVASSEGKSAIAHVTVGTVASASCSGSPVTLNPGDVRVIASGDRQQLCVAGGTAGSEYVLIPFSRETTGSVLTPVAFTASNTSAITSGPFLRAPEAPALNETAGMVPRDLPRRRLERAELSPLLAALHRSLPANQQRMLPGRRGITGLGATPTIGTLVTLNTQGDYGCSHIQLSTGRITVVSQHAIVLADTGAPANGFTAADYQEMATAFDTLVFPVDSANFGMPTDLDANGRVLIFFTQTVNAQTLPTSNLVLGGYFFARDLFPVSGKGACAGSNQGEMFYMPVADPGKKYNSDFADAAALKLNVIGTLGHEFQHLINAGRRMYITPATDFEEVWLDEGLAHIAEELAYYRSSGLKPRSNLDDAAILATTALKVAVNNYQVQNLARLSEYLKSPEANSPLDTNVTLAARGAVWQFLRYAADRRGGIETVTWRGLVDSPYTGLTSIAYVFGDAYSYLREWSVAQFTDDGGFPADSTHQMGSWNFRSVLPRLSSNGGAYPIVTRPLVGSTSFSVRGGSAAYVRFRVNAGLTATINGTLGSIVDLMLVRTQ